MEFGTVGISSSALIGFSVVMIHVRPHLLSRYIALIATLSVILEGTLFLGCPECNLGIKRDPFLLLGNSIRNLGQQNGKTGPLGGLGLLCGLGALALA